MYLIFLDSRIDPSLSSARAESMDLMRPVWTRLADSEKRYGENTIFPAAASSSTKLLSCGSFKNTGGRFCAHSFTYMFICIFIIMARNILFHFDRLVLSVAILGQTLPFPQEVVAALSPNLPPSHLDRREIGIAYKSCDKLLVPRLVHKDIPTSNDCY